MFKTFQISHPVDSTPFQACRSEREMASLAQEFATRLTGDVMQDFRHIKVDGQAI